MLLQMNRALSDNYHSKSQIARVITESWMAQNMFCPNCGAESLEQFANNSAVADFHCIQCIEEYELKSKHALPTSKIVDGQYDTMIKRLNSQNNPSLFFLHYNQNLEVENLFAIPKYFFTSEIIEKRPPLALTAKRAGWIGCNILFSQIPQDGKIAIIKNSREVNKKDILRQWQKTSFLSSDISLNSRGWIIDVLKVIEAMAKSEFSIQDIYKFEIVLQMKHPKNNNIQAKIRQQLQLLRDKNYLSFSGNGKYTINK